MVPAEDHLLTHSLLQVKVVSLVEVVDPDHHQVFPLEVAVDPAVQDLRDLQAHHREEDANNLPVE